MLLKVFSAELHPLAEDTFGIPTKPVTSLLSDAALQIKLLLFPRQTVFPTLPYVSNCFMLKASGVWERRLSG